MPVPTQALPAPVARKEDKDNCAMAHKHGRAEKMMAQEAMPLRSARPQRMKR